MLHIVNIVNSAAASMEYWHMNKEMLDVKRIYEYCVYPKTIISLNSYTTSACYC